jgi:hypothetical protein
MTSSEGGAPVVAELARLIGPVVVVLGAVGARWLVKRHSS